ncbi:5-formyltetrahydrofolate cyclo-ligase [Enterovibrio sp. ZSDZ35]|uniref:5-formyltetrahydrofolate cyclo-ligase n=1 Tax=Enterovibrio qingdaonensis TaxID=2899818 RepID=A0ABT5QR01_9GAMM|nr:5-formyltetrahydrofolate cyclo-ligase [Enterovibrio sp. ZSDZ35]MDD1782940.1 5-formyltetrahydrofolate cyclo-ligase [Enterovibrio sp. ZSDZ35]
MQANTSEQRTLLRQQIRQRRRALTEESQHLAAHQLLTCVEASDAMSNAAHIALYLSVDGELDTTPLIERCWRKGQSVYLPVIHPFSKGHLLFLHYHPNSHLIPNRYGILEPKLDVRDVLPARKLDVICTPLVAFDAQGQRLGMGGGYYDRTLAQWYETGEGARPIGLAHDCQQVDRLPVEAWDIPLPEILTPNRHWSWDVTTTHC